MAENGKNGIAHPFSAEVSPEGKADVMMEGVVVSSAASRDTTVAEFREMNGEETQP